MQRDKVPRLASSSFISSNLNNAGSSASNGQSIDTLCTTGAIRAWCHSVGSA